MVANDAPFIHFLVECSINFSEVVLLYIVTSLYFTMCYGPGYGPPIYLSKRPKNTGFHALYFDCQWLFAYLYILNVTL